MSTQTNNHSDKNDVGASLNVEEVLDKTNIHNKIGLIPQFEKRI